MAGPELTGAAEAYVAALVTQARAAGAAEEREQITAEVDAQLQPTDRGFVRADDPETTRWMDGWDEAVSIAVRIARDSS